MKLGKIACFCRLSPSPSPSPHAKEAAMIPVAKVELSTTISQIPEGIISFDQENGILTVDKSGVMTSAISFVDDKGGDLGDYKFKTNVPAADKMWCLASCSKATPVPLRGEEHYSESSPDHNRCDSLPQRHRGGHLHDHRHAERRERRRYRGSTPGTETGAAITQFLIPGQISSVINYPTITITMPEGTDVTALKPVIVVTEGSTVTPGSGVAADFTDAVRYQVINEKANDSKTYFAVVTTNSTGGGGTPGAGKETNPNFKPFDMVTVGAGSFILGKQPSEYYLTVKNIKDEKNSHKVNISAFEIGRYEVTQREFLQVMGYNPSNDKSNDLYPSLKK